MQLKHPCLQATQESVSLEKYDPSVQLRMQEPDIMLKPDLHFLQENENSV